MLSALVIFGGSVQPPSLEADLAAAGITVISADESTNIVQTTLAAAPDLVIFCQDRTDTALFESASSLSTLAPRPLIVFTLDSDADNIARAMQAGIHAYVIDGYSANRLRAVIHLAQARFRRDRLLREELAQANQRFEERKLVDRAKGILMGARQLREEEAYRVLRRVAMQTKQRIGQVSQRVIDSARYAEAVNRAGQLRMLSQRVVKLYALACANVRPGATPGLLLESMALVDDTLATLERNLSRPTFGDLMQAVAAPWQSLKLVLDRPPTPSRLQEVDRMAEEVLLRSEQLTANLEISGFATALHVINVAGRQRMLSQRLAKAALLATLLDEPFATAARSAVASTTAELIDGMGYLLDLPLSNADISRELAATARLWERVQQALQRCGTGPGREELADLSESLLEHFDRLTTQFERAMQAFVAGSMDAADATDAKTAPRPRASRN